MKDGFIRVASATPPLKVGDPVFNSREMMRFMDEASHNHVKILTFPELAITGYTCQDLFLQHTLLQQAECALEQIIDHSAGMDLLLFVGMPWQYFGKLYNVAAVIGQGKLLGLVPKMNIPNYAEFYEARYFQPGWQKTIMIHWRGQEIPFGSNLLFQCTNCNDLVVAAEICEDVWVTCPPSNYHVQAGATLIANCSASDEAVGKGEYRESLILGQSARLVCAYLYANAGAGESTQDLVFGGHNIIAENGTLLAASTRYQNGLTYADLDLQRLVSERRKMSTFLLRNQECYTIVDFGLQVDFMTELTRFVDPAPFVPNDSGQRQKRCEEILMIQTMGLKKRLEHTGITHAILGISGGLDSTLALLVTVKAFDLLGIPREQIHTITMPCFGTTGRTYDNACQMSLLLGTSLKEVDIKRAVTVHFEDIGQALDCHDVTYENGQARERTQVLMDLANQWNGLVVGTGDMSELALGWATYNGDHMSMYGVNASVPKTLVRHLVQYYAEQCAPEQLQTVLFDVLDTPVSPELLPPKDGTIVQRTEDLVGPYELHDFFLYYILRFGYAPAKIYRMAKIGFRGVYENEVILKWLKIFYRRFFSQQFKRSCLPDGPKIGSVALSPRGDLRMPSDASAAIWLAELENL